MAPPETKLILCPINLRHAELDYSEYEEAVAMAKRRGGETDPDDGVPRVRAQPEHP